MCAECVYKLLYSLNGAALVDGANSPRSLLLLLYNVFACEDWECTSTSLIRNPNSNDCMRIRFLRVSDLNFWTIFILFFRFSTSARNLPQNLFYGLVHLHLLYHVTCSWLLYHSRRDRNKRFMHGERAHECNYDSPGIRHRLWNMKTSEIIIIDSLASSEWVAKCESICWTCGGVIHMSLLGRMKSINKYLAHGKNIM